MKYSEIIPHYIDITDNRQRIVFYDNLRLSGKKIKTVSVLSTAGGATLPTGRQIVPSSAIYGFYLVLVNRSREIINQIPLSEIAEMEEKGFPLDLFGNEIDISSCYVMQPVPDTNLVGYSILLNFCISPNNNDELKGYIDHIAVNVKPNSGNYARIYFPDQQSFIGRRLLAITSIKATAATPDGYTNYYSGALAAGQPTVTLIDTDGRMITDSLPLSLITDFTAPVGFNRYQFDGSKIDWARSFVEINGTTAAETQLFFNLSLTKNW